MRKIIRILTNKYLLTGTLFAVWVTFFDNNDLFTQQQRKRELSDARTSIGYLRAEIAEMKATKDGIRENPAMLEKFAREHYHLKKDNEDVYVFD